MSFFWFTPFAPALAETGGDGEKLRRLGEHLSSECVTCHRSGGMKGIPAISGLSPDVLIKALKEYRDGVRPNPVMASIARSLSEEEMRALAAHFGRGGQPRKNGR